MITTQPAQILATIRSGRMANIGGRPVIVSPRKPATRDRSHAIKLVLAFLTTYVVWGSTYLAIRYAVATIPPLVAVAIRHTVAGGILLAWALARGYRPKREHLAAGFIVGLLYFALGHGLLHWAEKSISSAPAALLMATEPMFIMLVGWIMGQQRPHRLSGVGFVAGLAGVGILIGPDLTRHGSSTLGLIAALVSSLAWSVGVVVSARVKLPNDAVARTAMPLIFGAAMLWAAAIASGEWHGFHASDVSARSWMGLAFLIVFGSVIAFTAYTWLLQQCSPALVATHTYANPIVAVLLGWLLAGEVLSARLGLAAVVILGAIVLIRRGERAAAKGAAKAVCAPQEIVLQSDRASA
jgi:drug/metabolite transporter (DMT)-like permease